MKNDPYGLIGTIYEDAYVYGMLYDDAREKWYDNVIKFGVEIAGEKLISEECQNFIDLENENIPWCLWAVVDYNPKLQCYCLIPFTCDADSELVKQNDDSFIDLNPIKLSGIFSHVDDSMHDVYFLQGYPIAINEDEMLKYHKHLTVMRTIVNDFNQIQIGELYNA